MKVDLNSIPEEENFEDDLENENEYKSEKYSNSKKIDKNRKAFEKFKKNQYQDD
jgi:hypothetical protein